MTHAKTASSFPAQGYVLMLASTICFTANVLIIRALAALESVDVWLTCAVRFAVGLAVLALMYRRDARFLRVFQRGKLISRGLVGGLATCGFYLTIVHLGAGLATFIGNTYVIIAAIMAVVLLQERFRLVLAVGGIATLVGLALLTNAFSGYRHSPFYLGVAVLTAFASAYVVITIRQLHAEEHTATIFAAQCVYGLLVCLAPIGLSPSGASAQGWALMLLAGACVAAGQLSMTHAYRDMSVAEGTLLQMLVPVGVALGGQLLFHEQLSAREIAGGVLILVGAGVTAWRR